jgi:hypothetical protein
VYVELQVIILFAKPDDMDVSFNALSTNLFVSVKKLFIKIPYLEKL